MANNELELKRRFVAKAEVPTTISTILTSSGDGTSAPIVLLGAPEHYTSDLAARVEKARMVTKAGVAKVVPAHMKVAAVDIGPATDPITGVVLSPATIRASLYAKYGAAVRAAVQYSDGGVPTLAVVLEPADGSFRARQHFDPGWRPTMRTDAPANELPREVGDSITREPRSPTELRIVAVTLPIAYADDALPSVRVADDCSPEIDTSALLLGCDAAKQSAMIDQRYEVDVQPSKKPRPRAVLPDTTAALDQDSDVLLTSTRPPDGSYDVIVCMATQTGVINRPEGSQPGFHQYVRMVQEAPSFVEDLCRCPWLRAAEAGPRARRSGSMTVACVVKQDALSILALPTTCCSHATYDPGPNPVRGAIPAQEVATNVLVRTLVACSPRRLLPLRSTVIVLLPGARAPPSPRDASAARRPWRSLP